jgi:hypothetical protein
MLQPTFAAARGTARTKDKVGTWFASPHYRELDARTGGELEKPQNSAYDFGFDGLELMELVNHSAQLGFIRWVGTAATLGWAHTAPV